MGGVGGACVGAFVVSGVRVWAVVAFGRVCLLWPFGVRACCLVPGVPAVVCPSSRVSCPGVEILG